MFLRMMTILLGITLLLVPSVYSDTCSNYTNDLKVYITWRPYDEGESWLYTWHADKIQKIQARYLPKERTNVRQGASDKRSESLPQSLMLPDDKRFDTPFEISRNGELLIAAIYRNTFALDPSKIFALVDIKRKRIIRILEAGDFVHSLAWSPDGNYFAVLYSEDVTKKTLKRFLPLSLFADLVGHPISYRTLYLSLYDSAGTLLCTQNIIEKIPQGKGYLDWGNRGQQKMMGSG